MPSSAARWGMVTPRLFSRNVSSTFSDFRPSRNPVARRGDFAVPDTLGFRKRIGIVVPSTNTTVQPECEALRPRGVTNHTARSTIRERPLNTEQAFLEHMADMREGIATAIDQIMTAGVDHL